MRWARCAANSRVRFSYIGLFQENMLNPRFLTVLRVRQRRIPHTKSGRSVFEKNRRLLEGVENLHVISLQTVNATHVEIPNFWRGQRLTFQNDYRQISLIYRASLLIPHRSEHVLRLREDAGWFSSFVVHRTRHLHFKNCMYWGGINDKIWYGPRDEVVLLIRKYFGAFRRSDPFKNTEAMLNSAVSNMSVRFVTINMSDAIEVNGALCFRKFYLCHKSVVPRIC